MIPGVSRISHQKCPDCESDAISVRVDHRHCNGQWNEYVTYRCGLELHWSPNFERVITQSLCSVRKKTVTVTVPVNLSIEVPWDTDLNDIVIGMEPWGWNFNLGLKNSADKRFIKLVRVEKADAARSRTQR